MTNVNVQSLLPLRDGVVVQRDEQPTTTAFGIVLPEKSQDSPQWGKVLKVGPGKRGTDGHHIPMTVKVGDRVLFGQYAGSKFKCDGQEYLFMKEDDLMAVVSA
jgi:chaperonin GroES